MANKLTDHEVIAECEAMHAKGTPTDRITGHAIHARLGRGSRTTIYKHVNTWKAQKAGPAHGKTAPREGPHASPREGLQAIQQILDRLVDSAVADERARAGLEIDRLQEEKQQLVAALTDSHKKSADLQAEIAEARQSLAEEQDKRIKAEGAREWLERRLEEIEREFTLYRTRIAKKQALQDSVKELGFVLEAERRKAASKSVEGKTR